MIGNVLTIPQAYKLFNWGELVKAVSQGPTDLDTSAYRDIVSIDIAAGTTIYLTRVQMTLIGFFAQVQVDFTDNIGNVRVIATYHPNHTQRVISDYWPCPDPLVGLGTLTMRAKMLEGGTTGELWGSLNCIKKTIC